MYFKKIAVLMLGIIMISTLCSFFNSIFGNSMSPKRKMAYNITNNLSKKFKHDYELNFMGISEEAVDGKYKRIGVELSYNKILTKDQGRILLLNCAQDVLEAFNSNAKFEQYMTNVPFTNDNILINIHIKLPNGPDVNHPEIGVFSFFNNTLWYKTFVSEPPYLYSKEHESIEEAKKIVEGQIPAHHRGGIKNGGQQPGSSQPPIF